MDILLNFILHYTPWMYRNKEQNLPLAASRSAGKIVWTVTFINFFYTCDNQQENKFNRIKLVKQKKETSSLLFYTGKYATHF